MLSQGHSNALRFFGERYTDIGRVLFWATFFVLDPELWQTSLIFS
jgi:hypothetical protein